MLPDSLAGLMGTLSPLPSMYRLLSLPCLSTIFECFSLPLLLLLLAVGHETKWRHQQLTPTPPHPPTPPPTPARPPVTPTVAPACRPVDRSAHLFLPVPSCAAHCCPSLSFACQFRLLCTLLWSAFPSLCRCVRDPPPPRYVLLLLLLHVSPSPLAAGHEGYQVIK
jgi:hypothetical protein